MMHPILVSRIPQPIRIVGYFDDQYVNQCFHLYSGKSKSLCPFPGIEIEYLDTLLSGILNLTLKWIKVDSYKESLELVRNGSADFFANAEALVVEDPSTKQFYHSPVQTSGSVGLFVKMINIGEMGNQRWMWAQPLLFLESLDWMLWLLIGIITSTLLFAYRLAEILHSLSNPIQLVYTWWFIIVSLLLSTLSNHMATQLVQPAATRVFPFRSVEVLNRRLTDSSCILVMLHDNYFTVYSVVANSSFGKIVASIFENNRFITPRNNSDMANYILKSTPEKIYVGMSYVETTPFFEGKHCRIKLFPLSKMKSFFSMQHYVYPHTVKHLNQLLEPLMATDSVKAYVELLNHRGLHTN